MAQRIAYLEAVVGADITNFRREMRNVRSEIGVLSDTFRGLRDLGRLMTFGLTAPLVALGSGAVKAASDFDASMRNINSISNLTESELASLSSRVLEFGASLRDGPTAAAEGLYAVFSAGWENVDEAFIIMQSGAALAEAGLTDLAQTTETLTTTLLAYGAGAEDAATYADVWTATVQFGVGRLEDFTTAMGRTNSFAAAAGVTFQDFAGSVAFLTQNSLTAYNASTGMRNIFTKLLDPTKELQVAYSQLGVTSGTELMEKFGTLDSAMKALISTTDGSAEGFANLWGSIQAKQAALVFFNNLPRYTEFMGDFRDNLEGTTEAARAQQLKSFSAQVEILSSAVQSAGIAIGSVLLPPLATVAGFLAKTFIQVAQLNPGIIKMSVAALGLAAAIGPLLMVVGSLTSPIGLLIVGISALYTAFENNWKGISDTVTQAVSSIFGNLTPLLGAFDQIASDLFGVDLGLAENLKKKLPEEFTILADEIDSFVKTPLTGTMDFEMEVKAGWGLYDMYFSSDTLQEKFSGPVEFRTWFEETFGGDYVLQPGTMTLPLDTMLEGDGAPAQIVDEYYQQFVDAINNNGTLTGEDAPPSAMSKMIEGMKEKLAVAWSVLEPPLNAMKDHMVFWVKNTMLPSISDAGSNVMDYIASWFTASDTDVMVGGFSIEVPGASPIRAAFNELVTGHVFGAIDELFPMVGTKIKTSVTNWFNDMGIDGEAVKSKFSTGITTLVTFIKDTGVPALAEGFGYVAARGVIALAEGLKTVWGMLFGGGGGNGLASDAAGYVKDSVADPFMSGISSAFSDSSMGADGFQMNDLMEVLAAGLVAAAGVSVLGGFLTVKGLVTTLASTLITVIKGSTSGLSLLSSAASYTGVFQKISTGILGAVNGLGGMLFGGGFLSLIASAILFAFQGPGLLGALKSAASFSTIGSFLISGIGTGLAAVAGTIVTGGWLPIITIAALLTGALMQLDVDWGAIGGSIMNGLKSALSTATDFLFGSGDQEVQTTGLRLMPAMDIDPSELASSGGGFINGLIDMITNVDWAEVASTIAYTLGMGLAGILGGIAWAATNIVGPLFDSLKTAISTFDFSTIPGLLFDAFKFLAWDMPVWVFENIITPLFNGLKDGFGGGDISWSDIPTAIYDAIKNALPTMEQVNAWVYDNLVLGLGTAIIGFLPVVLGFINDLIPDNFSIDFGSINLEKDLGPFGTVSIHEDLGSVSVSLPNPFPSAARAIGGPVMRGSSYLVGENGPEMFSPSRSGTIIPNNMLDVEGTSGTTIINNEIYVETALSVDQLLNELKRRGIRLEY